MKTYNLCGTWKAYKENDTENIFDIKVPGSWNETKGLKTYEGALFYEKVFEICDSDIDKNIEFHFGGIYRESEIYLNGKKIANHSGYQTPFRVDVTGKVLKRENVLKVKASNIDVHPELFCADLFKINPLKVSGIYERVTLEISDGIKFNSIYTPIDIEKGEAIAILSYKAFENTENLKLTVELSLNGDEIQFEREFNAEKGEGEIEISMPLELFKLWSPENPVLYNVKVKVQGENIDDEYSFKTGFKSLTAKGTDFYLNGTPYYLLGYGDDFVYPLGVPDAENKEFYYNAINKAKDYGFNFVRHHSHFPYEVYFDACDELGLLLQPELFLANVPRELLKEEHKEMFVNEWKALIKAYRHHPSLALYSGGNEMEWGYFFEKEIYEVEKKLDPYRLSATTDGNFASCDVGEFSDFASICPAEYTDYLPIRELDCMFTLDNCLKPQIVHEMGNYATMPNINETEKYKNAVVRHPKLDDLYKKVKENHWEAEYNKVYENSLSLQKLCHKINIEKARLSPFFAGYHIWTFTDYYGTTQGILNPFYEDKAFTAEEFSKINNQTVLLWDFEDFSFKAGEKAKFKIKLSKYGSDERIEGVLNIKTSFGKEITLNKSFEGHGIFDACDFECEIPLSEKEEKYSLEVKFTYNASEIKNSWEFFAVPDIKIGTEKEIYIHYLCRHIFEKENIPFRHFTIGQPIDENQLIVTDCVYGSMLDAVENGANMLILLREDTFKNTVKRNSFKSPWWDIGEIWYLNHTNNKQVAGVLQNHPALDFIPYKGSWNLDLFDAIEQAPSINLNGTDINAEAILYGSDLDLNKYTYLFETKLKKGKILVCGFNHKRSDMNFKQRYILKSLINYCMSEAFNPKEETTREKLNSSLN